MSNASHTPPDTVTNDETNPDRHHPGRFRFKTPRNDSDQAHNDLNGRKRHRRHHESSHRRKRRRPSPPFEDGRQHRGHSTEHLSTEQAFRESLFDALGDDEGATFWEGVYGQPIHQYADTYTNQDTGELERMSEDEYAQYVRRKMWEKSWEGIEAAREQRKAEQEEERRRLREERARMGSRHTYGHKDNAFEGQIEASLRRGRRRKEQKRWQELWQDYLTRWTELQTMANDRPVLNQGDDRFTLRHQIAWPVETGKRKDVSREEIEKFVRQGNSSQDTHGETADDFMSKIKKERVRWHPDKIQQRYGFMAIDEDTLQGVTAVFQVFDSIWNEMRQPP
ncbi:hypothetical protein PV10_06544 [Exophiala mesophila]|uniref:J domain-containing protein n=1 Tax=Exophiala mesophila TaxID=212818 RepID=A0A0D1WSE1_EXOME|nr:uncharacterized protein PV10_06544 [Exophiala mesophila]KIV92075.1 hypothetical protein PV10_06544 [Exophiala mesophila]